MKPAQAIHLEFEKFDHCEIHQVKWQHLSGSLASQECPWCNSDIYSNEIIGIQSIFKLAIIASECKGVTGAGHLSYAGDFVSVSASVTAQMKRWVRRWEKILCKSLPKKKD